MVTRITFRALLPMTASILIHVGLVVAIGCTPGWVPAAMPVLVADLVEAEAPPAVETAPPPPRPRPVPRPITPPTLAATPLPFESSGPVAPEPPPAPPLPELPEPVAPEPPAAAGPEPPARRAPEPAPVPRPPAAAGPAAAGDVPAVVAPVDRHAGAAAEWISREAAGPPVPPAARGPALAAIPSEGVTRRAIPRGGYQYRPAYPSRARRLGIQGTTLLHVLVSDRGRVAEVVVKQSAGHPDLDEAAAAAVRRWRFEPARNGTEAVQMWVQLPFEFRLR